MSLESRPIPTVHYPIAAPHVIQFGEHTDALPIGVAYLGGMALFNPEAGLTERQLQCGSLAMIGATNQQIGSELYLGVDTIKTYMRQAIKNTASPSRTGLLVSCLTTAEPTLTVTRAANPRLLPKLSEREKQVGALVSLGLTNQAIGDRLEVAYGTIKSHVTNIGDKMHSSSRQQLALTAILANWGQTHAPGPGRRPRGLVALERYYAKMQTVEKRSLTAVIIT